MNNGSSRTVLIEGFDDLQHLWCLARTLEKTSGLRLRRVSYLIEPHEIDGDKFAISLAALRGQ